jgi:hypothetical protein
MEEYDFLHIATMKQSLIFVLGLDQCETRFSFGSRTIGFVCLPRMLIFPSILFGLSSITDFHVVLRLVRLSQHR